MPEEGPEGPSPELLVFLVSFRNLKSSEDGVFFVNVILKAEEASQAIEKAREKIALDPHSWTPIEVRPKPAR